MSEKQSRWGVLKVQNSQKTYEKLEVPDHYNNKYSADGTLDLDRNSYLEDSLLSNLFEDMSMSTNTGPPSYDVRDI